MSVRATILIVEDSFIVAYHLKTTLESEGYGVIATIDSGEGTLSFLKSEKPDLVLMDIMLNGKLDGVETARIIRSEYNIPIIYITALTDRTTIQRAKITEPYGYLTKPFEDREIFTVIEMALYKHEIESKLRASEEKYFSTVRSISDAVLVIDEKFCVTYINPCAEALLETGFSDLSGKSFFEVFQFGNDDSGAISINPLQCEITSGRINSIPRDLFLNSKNGVRRMVGEGSLSPLVDNKGNSRGLVIIFKDLTQKLEHEKLIHHFEKERLAAVLEGQERERSRIAKDLHDGLGQMLTAIKMNLQLAVPNEKQAVYFSKLIDDAIQESVRISENLLPSSLKDFDLDTCINNLCEQMCVASKSKISFDSQGDCIELDQHQKINFFRIAQEAVNNAIKHSNASNISVQLTYDDNSTILTIEDDGLGFQYSSTQSSGFGLGNMRDRAQIMGGKFTIESDTNRGTLIIVEVPLAAKMLSL